MRTYELMTVLRPDLGGEEEYTNYIETLQGFVTAQGGEVVEVNHSTPWGRRKLAYEIEDFTEGYYVLSYIKLDPTAINEFERSLKLAEPVMRYLLLADKNRN